MEQEVNFRSSVGGYKKDDVIEYVENTNEEIFRMKKEREEEAVGYQARIQELEALLRQEETNSSQLAEEQSRKLQRLEGENQRLQEDLDKMEAKWKSAYEEYVRTDNEKCLLKDKLAREILRLRGENQTLREKWKEAERQIGSQADYEAVHNAVSEVQYKIAEYVNAINKTQQSLADTYQGMNSIKKKLAAKMTGEKEEAK